MNILFEPDIAKYVAVAVALASWIGLFIWLWQLDRRVRMLRHRLGKLPPGTGTTEPTRRATLHAALDAQATRPETNDSRSTAD